MEHVPIFTLLVLTLLQVCRTEIPVLPGPWYSANVITDGDFSPKPISEIFTSQSTSPFSPTNPIVVLPTSTSKPSSSASTAFPVDYSSSFSTGDYSSSYSTAATLERFESSTPSSLPTQFNFGSLPTGPSSPQFVFDLPQPGSQQPNQQPNQQPPNYFVIYQQAPQSVQNYPTAPLQTQSTFPSSTPQPVVSGQSTLSTISPIISTPQSTFSTQQSTFSTPQSTFSTPQSTFSTSQTTFSTPPSTFSTAPSTFSTPQSTFSTGSLSSFQPSSDSTFPSNLPSQPSSTISPSSFAIGPNGLPCATASPGSPRPTFPSLRIRVLAPSGSITNVNVNPATTTRRPSTRRSTTTRRPTTTRTKRPRRNRNSYDGCVNACNGRKAPICASPLAQTPVDPNTLKGFPSVCHMACHNSFRNNQYEMIVEGRCGRLRNRIRTVDSNKLTRNELNKAQYTVVGDPQTVVEFSSLPRK